MILGIAVERAGAVGGWAAWQPLVGEVEVATGLVARKVRKKSPPTA
jgi:hypothetical protein